MADLTMPQSTLASVAVPAASSLAFYVDSVLGTLCRKDSAGRSVPVAEFTVNVLDFGADPTGATDSTTAILNAVAAVVASSTASGIVYFPPGAYIANTTGSSGISVTVPIRFIGAGQFITSISFNDSTHTIFYVRQWYVTFEQLTLTSPTTTVAAASNGQALNALTGNQLFVASTTGFAAASSICVFDSTGTINVIAYTSVTGGASPSFNGCSGGGATTVATSAVVNQRTVGGYTIDGGAFGNEAWLWIRNCVISNQYDAVRLMGVQNNIEDTSFTQTAHYGILINQAAAEVVLSNVTMNQLPQAVSNIAVGACGSLQILNCNLIHGGINLLLAAGAGAGIFSVYAENTYFDTANTGVSMTGSTGAIQRCQFVGCWMSSQATQGVLLNNPLISGLSFVNCHMHLNASGIVVTQALDWAVVGCRISGVGAGAGTGISITQIANEFFQIEDCVIGNNGGGTTFATGIAVAAGTYSHYMIHGNDLSTNTATLTDLGTATVKSIHDNLGCAVTGAPIVANSGAINTSATILATSNVNAGLQVGTSFKITLIGTCTASVANASTFTVRFGTAGTTGDGTIATAAFTSATSGTNVPFKVEIFLTVRTVGSGSSATVVGYATAFSQGAAGVATGLIAQNTEMIVTTDTAFNSTINGILSIGYISAATTTTSTFILAYIEVIKA